MTESSRQGSRRPLRVVVAPDSFKGSCTAEAAAQAIGDGVRDALESAGRHGEITTRPYADGGEGSLDTIAAVWHLTIEQVPTTDAIGRPTTGRVGFSPDGRIALIEAAEANGLPAVSDVPLRPLEATSRGVGVLIEAALERGAREIILFAGGSASTDAGAGLLAALGARLLAADGTELPDGGGALGDLDDVDLTGLRLPAGARFRIACDVDNPLTGERGAARVFGPQKGAAEDAVTRLDAALTVFADTLERVSSVDVRDTPGSGAAGGIAAPLLALASARLEPGWRIVAEAIGLPEALAAADLVFTGEGRFDSQSLDGKAISAVRALTPEGVPVVVLAGEIALDPAAASASGITTAVAIARGPRDLDALSRSVTQDLRTAAASLTRLFLDGQASGSTERDDEDRHDS